MPAVKQEALEPHSDLTFRVFDDLVVEDVNLHQSLLNGCLIRNCVFRRTKLSRCDMEQIQISNCTFTGVDLTNVQLTSTQFNNSTFRDCKFDSALIEECIWKNSVFESCSFRQSVLQHSTFEKCTFKSCDYLGASVQLNIFRDTTFEDMVLGNCTFLNQIMVGCKFAKVRVAAECVGSIYGLSESDIQSFDLIYLGQTVSSIDAPSGLIDSLERDYERRRWFFMKEMVRLNFGRTSLAYGLNLCLDAILWPASVGTHLRGGDIAFLELVIMEMFRKKELPALAAITIPDKIRSFCVSKRGVAENQIGIDRLLQLANRLNSLLLKMVPDLVRSIGRHTPDIKDSSVELQLVFEQKPNFDVDTFLNDLGSASGFPVIARTRRLREEAGSYILVVQTTLLTLSAFRVALWLLNGCAFQLIELKTRVEVIRRKRSPKIVRDRLLLKGEDFPLWTASGIHGVFDRIMSKTPGLEEIANELGPTNFKGARLSRKASPRKKTSRR